MKSGDEIHELSYDLIKRAVHGEPEAVNTVLSHYAGYIRYYSRIYGHVDFVNSQPCKNIALPMQPVRKHIRIGCFFFVRSPRKALKTLDFPNGRGRKRPSLVDISHRTSYDQTELASILTALERSSWKTRKPSALSFSSAAGIWA